MSKRQRRHTITLDPSVAEVLAAPPGKKPTNHTARSKATYDLDPETIQSLRDLAAELEVPVYAMAQKLLDYALQEYHAGRLELQRRPVVTMWGLE